MQLRAYRTIKNLNNMTVFTYLQNEIRIAKTQSNIKKLVISDYF